MTVADTPAGPAPSSRIDCSSAARSAGTGSSVMAANAAVGKAAAVLLAVGVGRAVGAKIGLGLAIRVGRGVGGMLAVSIGAVTIGGVPVAGWVGAPEGVATPQPTTRSAINTRSTWRITAAPKG